MHKVQCPHCRSKFKVQAPVTDARMKCGRCGRVFVASSTEVPDKPAEPDQTAFVPPVRPMHLSKATSHRSRSKTSSTSIILLIAGIFGILGVITMAIVAYYKVIEQEKTLPVEAERKVARHHAEADGGVQLALPKPSPDSPGRTIKGDPELQPGWEIVRSGTAETPYICGSVLNAHTVAQKQITVTVYINGAQGPSRTYQFVPPKGVIRFSIRLGGRKVDEKDIKVVAAGEPADKDRIIWAIDIGRMNFKEENGRIIWSGRTRNRSSVPVKDVKIYCDFFDDEGIQGNDKPVIGELVSARTIGVGKSADFRVEFDAVGASVYDTVVARAVGQKY